MKISISSLFVLLLVCLFNTTVYGSESATVILKNDSSYTGIVLARTASEVVLRMDDASIKTIRRTQIKEIIEHGEVNETTVDKVRGVTTVRGTIDSDPDKFASIGATFGTPAGINIRGGTHDGKFAIHASGMVFGEGLYGAQINVMWCFAKNVCTESYLSPVAGYSHVGSSSSTSSRSSRNTLDYGYVGLAYVLHSRGFLLELGMATPGASFDYPQFILQIGYVAKLY